MCMYTSLREEEHHTLSMPLSFSIDYVKSDREYIYTCKLLREEENHSLFQCLFLALSLSFSIDYSKSEREYLYTHVHHCERKRITLSPCLALALPLSLSIDYSKSKTRAILRMSRVCQMSPSAHQRRHACHTRHHVGRIRCTERERYRQRERRTYS